jgi:hypothetical protein
LSVKCLEYGTGGMVRFDFQNRKDVSIWLPTDLTWRQFSFMWNGQQRLRVCPGGFIIPSHLCLVFSVKTCKTLSPLHHISSWFCDWLTSNIPLLQLALTLNLCISLAQCTCKLLKIHKTSIIISSKDQKKGILLGVFSAIEKLVLYMHIYIKRLSIVNKMSTLAILTRPLGMCNQNTFSGLRTF